MYVFFPAVSKRLSSVSRTTVVHILSVSSISSANRLNSRTRHSRGLTRREVYCIYYSQEFVNLGRLFLTLNFDIHRSHQYLIFAVQLWYLSWTINLINISSIYLYLSFLKTSNICYVTEWKNYSPESIKHFFHYNTSLDGLKHSKLYTKLKKIHKYFSHSLFSVLVN